jgi:hypothetical protein
MHDSTQDCILVSKAMVPKEVLALIAIYGQLGQICIDLEYYNQHAGNTVTHVCSEGTPRGGNAVLHGNAGKIEKSSKYLCNQPNQERNTFSVSLPRNIPGL